MEIRLMASLHSRLFFRLVARNREIYLLKLLTLAIAFACATIISLFSLNEFGYDRIHDQPESVFRIISRSANPTVSGNRLSNQVHPSILEALQFRAGNALYVARVKNMNETTISVGQHIFRNQKVHAAESSITNIFSFAVRQGSLRDFGQKGKVAILSRSAAEEYFGTAQAVGETLDVSSLGHSIPFLVVAVFEDFPSNTHDDFRVLISFDQDAIASLGFEPNEAAAYGRILHGSTDSWEVTFNQIVHDENFQYILQSLPEIYFGPRVDGEASRHGDKYSITILMCITGLIVFLAITGFINLTTLTLPYRSKELAVKKLAGTRQLTLTWTFLKESLILSTLSLMTGVLLIALSAGFIRQVLPVELWTLLTRGVIQLLLVTGVVFLIVVGAPLVMTPRFVRATPARLLSTDIITFPGLKRRIAFLQLGISIFLIISSVVIRRQVNYSLIKEPGQNYYQVVHMPYPADLTLEGLRAIRLGWQKYNPNIVDVMAVSQLPDRINSKETNSDFYTISADPEFINFFRLEIISGRAFAANDGDSIFMVNRMGSSLLDAMEKNMIGVVSDISGKFNQPEKPLKIKIARHTSYQYLCVRIMEVDIRRTLKYLSTFYDGRYSEVTFFDKQFEDWLHYQDRLNRLSQVLTLVSALLACCSIYGLCLSLVRDKLKEIAVRRVYGASHANITRILAGAFAGQVVKAMIFFGPVTFLFLREWLRNFAYVTPFSWTDPVLPVTYCAFVIVVLCAIRAYSIKNADLARAIKS